MKRIAISVALALSNAVALPQTPSEDPMSKEQITTLVNNLARCAGVYEAMSGFSASEGQQATSATLHQQHNGAKISAMYLLALEHGLHSEEPKEIGAFAPYVDGIVETSITYMLMLIEQQDLETIREKTSACSALGPVQDKIVQMLRDSEVGR